MVERVQSPFVPLISDKLSLTGYSGGCWVARRSRTPQLVNYNIRKSIQNSVGMFGFSMLQLICMFFNTCAFLRNRFTNSTLNQITRHSPWIWSKPIFLYFLSKGLLSLKEQSICQLSFFYNFQLLAQNLLLRNCKGILDILDCKNNFLVGML